jgi:hypothetical protein
MDMYDEEVARGVKENVMIKEDALPKVPCL